MYQELFEICRQILPGAIPKRLAVVLVNKTSWRIVRRRKLSSPANTELQQLCSHLWLTRNEEGMDPCRGSYITPQGFTGSMFVSTSSISCLEEVSISKLYSTSFGSKAQRLSSLCVFFMRAGYIRQIAKTPSFMDLKRSEVLSQKP